VPCSSTGDGSLAEESVVLTDMDRVLIPDKILVVVVVVVVSSIR